MILMQLETRSDPAFKFAEILSESLFHSLQIQMNCLSFCLSFKGSSPSYL